MRAKWSSGLAALTAIVAPLASAPAWGLEGQGYAAMQVAYGREVTAQASYLAFAKQADQEGRPSVACLFRAVARAESVHAARHALAIEQLGGRAAVVADPFTVGTTRENLEVAILTEQKERVAIYPRLADFARVECLYDALSALNDARSAEATHEAAFRWALWAVNSAAWPDGSAEGSPLASPMRPDDRSAYICLGDGSVFLRPVKSCPNCGTGGSLIVRHCESMSQDGLEPLPPPPGPSVHAGGEPPTAFAE